MKNKQNLNSKKVQVQVPVVSYTNLEINKHTIYQENHKKSGIYRWNNTVNGNSYIGSAVDLNRRLSNYFSIRFLEKEIRRNRSIISNALLKYGYNKFSLDILEYCDKEILISREQYYIDTLQCKYNIQKVAGSHLGVKRSQETILKLKQRKFTQEALVKMSLAKKGKTPIYSALRIKNHLLACAHPIVVMNKENNTKKIYESINTLCKSINISKPTVKKYMNSSIWFKNKYLINSYKKI